MGRLNKKALNYRVLLFTSFRSHNGFDLAGDSMCCMEGGLLVLMKSPGERRDWGFLRPYGEVSLPNPGIRSNPLG